MKRILTAAVCVLGFAMVSAASLPQAIFDAYLRLEIARQVAHHAGEMGKAAEGEAWCADAMGAIRKGLVDAFGDEDAAQESFAAFVNTYAAAQEDGDLEFLAAFARNLGFDPPPEDFAAMRAAAMERDLQNDIAEAGKFLASLEEPPAAKPKRRRNALRDSEAKSGKFVEAKDDSKSSLRGFADARKARRDRALKEARESMAQVAEAKRIADEEANAKKLAAAQADAAAMQSAAQKLAAAEQEAAAQRQNSWSARLKSVATSAIGATGGAFLGTVGNRAGESAAHAIFGR